LYRHQVILLSNRTLFRRIGALSTIKSRTSPLHIFPGKLVIMQVVPCALAFALGVLVSYRRVPNPLKLKASFVDGAGAEIDVTQALVRHLWRKGYVSPQDVHPFEVLQTLKDGDDNCELFIRYKDREIHLTGNATAHLDLTDKRRM
jgi:hypothetical protein